jgi:hypothetical protein
MLMAPLWPSRWLPGNVMASLCLLEREYQDRAAWAYSSSCRRRRFAANVLVGEERPSTSSHKPFSPLFAPAKTLMLIQIKVP